MQLRHFKRSEVILQELGDGQYAISLAGARDLRYFSLGQRGQAPYVDMAYGLGGFWYSPTTNQIYWCALDKQLGCALISCDNARQASVIYSERLPACFQIAGGEEATGCILLHRGSLDRGWFRAGDYVLVDPNSSRGTRCEAQRIAHYRLSPSFVPTPSLSREGQVIRGTAVGEFRLGTGTSYIVRMALSEGETPELSVWVEAHEFSRRLAPSLRSVESWTWLSHRGKPVVIASTGVYADVPSIVVWRSSRGDWEIVKRFSGYAFVQIIRADSRGWVICEAVKSSKTRYRYEVRVF